MNYDQPRELRTGGFHYTRRNDDRVYAIGYCAEHEPHPTEDEARDCYTRYLLDRHLVLDNRWSEGPDTLVLHRCKAAEGCETMTDTFADIRPWGPSFDLCDAHRDREHVAALLGRVGDSIHS